MTAAYNDHDLDHARAALFAISPDLSHDEWVRAGMAAHAAGLNFDDFDHWSAAGSSYDPQTCHTTWRSFRTTPGGVGAGTLFLMARESGWSDIPPKPAAQNLARPRQGINVIEVWRRCEPATIHHGYIARKRAAGVPLDMLRVVPAGDSLIIAGQSLVGYLMVPAFAPDGAMQSAQFIPPSGSGKKLNLTGTHMTGASFTVGADGGPAFLCEGIGAAWACWQATGQRAVCCFGWGNVRRVAEAIRARDPGVGLVLVPDVGKESEAIKIARNVGAAVAAMPDGWPQNSDVGDLAEAEGSDALTVLLERATEPPKPPTLLKPVSVADVLTNSSPAPEFIWEGYLPRGVVSLLGAHGGVGKSTLALMLAVCVALGIPLFGVNTVPCKVLFLSLEDGANIIRNRIASFCRIWNIDPDLLRENLIVVDGTEHPELFSADSRGTGEPTATYFELRRLVQSEGMGLVIVDNASDGFGGDEIQRRQVRAFVRSLAEVARLTNCAVMLLAHVDKATSRAGRGLSGESYSGSTAWHNSVRSRLFMSRDDNGQITFEHQKSNFGKMREPLTLEWREGGLPQLCKGDDQQSGFVQRAEGRIADEKAIAILRMVAEFETRGQYCSPASTSRSHVYAMLKSEPAFQRLKLRTDDTKRIVNQCQRAGWIEPLNYRTIDRKLHQRWTLTTTGKVIAGLAAPTAPTAPTTEDGASKNMAQSGAPTAPTCVGGVGGARAHLLGQEGAA